MNCRFTVPFSKSCSTTRTSFRHNFRGARRCLFKVAHVAEAPAVVAQAQGVGLFDRALCGHRALTALQISSVALPFAIVLV
jgi:hypothetical protein